MVGSKLAIFVIEQIVRAWVKNSSTANGPSFALIAATLLGSAALLLSYNFEMMDRKVEPPIATKKLTTLESSYDMCMQDYVALEHRYRLLKLEVSQ